MFQIRSKILLLKVLTIGIVRFYVFSSSLTKGFWSAPLLKKNVFSRSGADQKPLANEDDVFCTYLNIWISLSLSLSLSLSPRVKAGVMLFWIDKGDVSIWIKHSRTGRGNKQKKQATDSEKFIRKIIRYCYVHVRDLLSDYIISDSILLMIEISWKLLRIVFKMKKKRIPTPSYIKQTRAFGFRKNV